jgi:DNA invertase Pin-like site-specific DNA recombinase
VARRAPAPGLEDLKQQRRRFSTVIVPKLSRFGRSVSELVQLFDLFDADDVALVFLDLNVDSRTSYGRLLRHVVAAFAEYKSDVRGSRRNLSRRLSASCRRAPGKCGSGP